MCVLGGGGGGGVALGRLNCTCTPDTSAYGENGGCVCGGGGGLLAD